MKANEYVEYYGWGAARMEVNNDTLHVGGISQTLHKDLKRLVEAHELVHCYGGLDKAKFALRMRIEAELYDSADELEKAITLVEWCQ